MRHRSRRGTNRSTLTCLCLVVTVLALAFGGGLEATAFTTGLVDRQSAVDVVSDRDGALQVDTADHVQINSTTSLVNTTNRLGQSITLTITLRSETADRGDLVVDGVNHGDQVSLSLVRAETTNVGISVPDDESLVGTDIRFDVRASASGIKVSATDRRVPIEAEST